MIPVVGFATYSRFDLADRLVNSIDYPVEHLVVVDNSGKGAYQPPANPFVSNVWVLPIPFGLGLVGAWNLIVKSTPYAPYWVLVNDDAWFEPGALAVVEKEVDPDALNFLICNPEWSCPVFGEGMIDKVGLYDERFYPLYFDDNDLERRVRLANVPVRKINAVVHHDNSASIKHEFNSLSFARNQRLYNAKQDTDDRSWGWTLESRRANRWD